jgi:hypothetical protein
MMREGRLFRREQPPLTHPIRNRNPELTSAEIFERLMNFGLGVPDATGLPTGPRRRAGPDQELHGLSFSICAHPSSCFADRPDLRLSTLGFLGFALGD